MNARRSAILLRCQQAREQRRRHDALRADQASAEAAKAERDTRDAAEAGRAAGAARLQDAYEDVGGRVVGLARVEALQVLQRALAREDEERDEAVMKAAAASAEARGAAAVARGALIAESRTTEKRSRLNGRAQTLWRRLVDATEELERDDEVADTWGLR